MLVKFANTFERRYDYRAVIYHMATLLVTGNNQFNSYELKHLSNISHFS